MINPNGMAAVVKNDDTYKDLVEILREKTDINSRAIVHLYDNYYSKGVFEWDIEYPKGFNPQDYKYNIELMKTLFERVIGKK